MHSWWASATRRRSRRCNSMRPSSLLVPSFLDGFVRVYPLEQYYNASRRVRLVGRRAHQVTAPHPCRLPLDVIPAPPATSVIIQIAKPFSHCSRYFLDYSASSSTPQFSWSCSFHLRPASPPPSSPIEIILAYAAPLPAPGQPGCNFSPACPVGYRMNVMKSGLQKCIRRQKAAAARACCDALAKQDLGQVMHLRRSRSKPRASYRCRSCIVVNDHLSQLHRR